MQGFPAPGPPESLVHVASVYPGTLEAAAQEAGIGGTVHEEVQPAEMQGLPTPQGLPPARGARGAACTPAAGMGSDSSP